MLVVLLVFVLPEVRASAHAVRAEREREAEHARLVAEARRLEVRQQAELLSLQQAALKAARELLELVARDRRDE